MSEADTVDRLVKLAELREKGLLTQEEFEGEKAKLLSESDTQATAPAKVAQTKKAGRIAIAVFGGGFLTLCVLFLLYAVLFMDRKVEVTNLQWPEPATEPTPAAAPTESTPAAAPTEPTEGTSLHNYEEVFRMSRSQFVTVCKREGGTIGKEELLTFCYFDDQADVGASFERGRVASSTVVRWDDSVYALAMIGALRDLYGNQDTEQPAGQCTNRIWVRDYYYGVMTCRDQSVFIVTKR